MNNELKSWFIEHKDDKPNNLYHSKTWKIMKEYLTIMGYWKNKARGKPNIKYLTNTIGTSQSYTHNTGI